MNISVKLLILTVVLLNIFTKISAESDQVCPVITGTIYSIRNGIVIFTHKNFWIGKPIWADYMSEVRKLKPNRANWYLEFVDGYVVFWSQEFSSFCLTYIGREHQLEGRTCDYLQDTQFFELIPTFSGASLIKVKDKNQCIYVYDGFTGYSVYTGDCPVGEEVDNKFLWSIVPSYLEKDIALKFKEKS